MNYKNKNICKNAIYFINCVMIIRFQLYILVRAINVFQIFIF